MPFHDNRRTRDGITAALNLFPVARKTVFAIKADSRGIGGFNFQFYGRSAPGPLDDGRQKRRSRATTLLFWKHIQSGKAYDIIRSDRGTGVTDNGAVGVFSNKETSLGIVHLPFQVFLTMPTRCDVINSLDAHSRVIGRMPCFTKQLPDSIQIAC